MCSSDLPHVVTDIGNGHHQPPPGPGGLGKDGIVKVACVGTIDRHKRQGGQVFIATELAAFDGLAELARLAHDGGRKLVRQLVRGDRKIHRRLRHTLLLQHTDHATHRRRVTIRRLDDGCNDQAAVDGIHGIPGRNDHPVTDTAVVGLHEADTALGLDNVPVFHANDSKGELGSHLDRHANIGEGYIGMEAFRRILNDRALRDKAFILETPIDNEGDDQRNVDALKSLIS